MPVYSAEKAAPGNRLKTDFVSAVLRDTAEQIRNKQREAVDEWSLFDTKNLRNSLTGHFSVANQEGGAKLDMRYLAYTRFLDLPDERRKINVLKREGYHLYNRIIFGTIYNKTLPTIKYGFTDEIREQMGKAMLEAIATEENKAELIAKSLR